MPQNISEKSVSLNTHFNNILWRVLKFSTFFQAHNVLQLMCARKKYACKNIKEMVVAMRVK